MDTLILFHPGLFRYLCYGFSLPTPPSVWFYLSSSLLHHITINTSLFLLLLFVISRFRLVLLLHSESISSGIGSAGILSLLFTHTQQQQHHTHFWMDTFFDRQCTFFYFFLLFFGWTAKISFLSLFLSTRFLSLFLISHYYYYYPPPPSCLF